ncbi:glycosyltransferase family 4 protein [Candidatus Curtissbacteria bacterium]|nr:glycosyltransferase family 4 protein [Candidatus Curtissbacteria bacterium]
MLSAKLFLFFAERWNLYLKPDVFVASTKPTAIWAKNTCPWTRVETIPYGVDVSIYSKAEPIKLTLERPVILCPAATVRYKRVELAIKAVAKLKKGSLLHLGGGPLEDEIKRIGTELLGRKRFLSKVVPIGEMPGFYAACDLVTLPSTTQENSPMVFMEAMAAGKIVVTTDAPRSRWILGDAGVFVNPEKADEYSLALEHALNLKGTKEKVRKRAELFSWDKIAAEYEKVITNL